MVTESNGNNVLQQNVSEGLSEAIKYLVRQKYCLDRFMVNNRYICTNVDLYAGGYGPLEGYDFFSKVFPFVFKWKSIKQWSSMQVPTDMTIGCSWRWRTEHLEGSVEKWIDRFKFDRAKFGWIKPLGLVIPHEGKNRVDYHREKNVEYITADISEYSYPEPSRLFLCEISINGRTEYWIILDSRWVERIRHADWILPVLQAYGVRFISWPESFPEIQSVDKAFDNPTGHPEFLSGKIIDIQSVQEKNFREEELTNCSLLDIEGVQIDRKYLTKWFAGGVAGVTALAAINYIQWASSLSYLVGFFSGAALIFVMPSLLLPRNKLIDRLF